MAGERTGFGLNAVVHPFGVVRDFKLGGVSESSEMSEWARVVAEGHEKGNGRMTGANSSKRGELEGVPGLKYCMNAVWRIERTSRQNPLKYGSRA
jgi:hypothetical protein